MESWRKSLQDAIASWSDDDELVVTQFSPKSRRHGGSIPGRRTVQRDREHAHIRLFNDYFSESPVYDGNRFRRRFRMSRSLFNRVMEGVILQDEFFTQRSDAAGRIGLSPLQKCVAALRMLCYGLAANAVDEYIKIGESTAMESFKRFNAAIIDHFGLHYEREPTALDVQKCLSANSQRGFPGMFGSLDCTHLNWDKCPVALQGQYQDRSGKRSIVMEAVTGPDLWIWHSYIGLPGSNSDINVLDRSPLIEKLLRGVAPHCQYNINGSAYTMSYLLVDGIYPNWPIFMKTISQPQGEKHRLYAKMQEAVRKDVERGFGVLQSRFAVLKNP
ncbi:hypothetical protein AeMF1_016608, partial [Aphanomyces euteiches]